MDIKVYYEDETVESNNIFPNPLRCLVVGSSGSGKTNLALNIIHNKHNLKFQNIYVFSRSFEQPAYLELQDTLLSARKKMGREVGYVYSSCDDLIPLDMCKPNSLIIFDDCKSEKQDKIKEYFTRGRHKHISCIYLSQSYGLVDMQVIRNNLNMLCAFPQNLHYTKRIYDDFVGSDMSFDEFKNLCRRCWKEPYGFISIDTRHKVSSGKYKFQLNHAISNNGQNQKS